MHGECPFLVSALKSIDAQTHLDLIEECILVLDRPAENTVKDVLDYVKSSRLVYRILHSAEPGIVFALNLGVAAARSELITRLDSDDLMSPERIAKQVALFKSMPDLVLCGAQIETIDHLDKHLGSRSYPITDTQIRKTLKAFSPFAHPAVMFRKSTFDVVGGYRKFYEGAEDYDLWCRMSFQGKLYNLSEQLLKYRVHSGQVSVKFKHKQLLAERAVKISFRRTKRGHADLSIRFLNLEDWIKDLKRSPNWHFINFSIQLRVSYHSSSNSFVRIGTALLLGSTRPISTLRIVKSKRN